MALASAPRPDQPERIHFVGNEEESRLVRFLYDIYHCVDTFKDRDLIEIPHHYSYSDMLYIILAVCQNQPLSMVFYAMKRVLADDLQLKDLPEGLKLKAEKVGSIRSVFLCFCWK